MLEIRKFGTVGRVDSRYNLNKLHHTWVITHPNRLTASIELYISSLEYYHQPLWKTWLWTCTDGVAELYCKTLYFCCILISQFWDVEISLHYNLAFPSVLLVFTIRLMGKLNFCGYLISQLFPSRKIRENLMHAKNTCFTVIKPSLSQNSI